MHSDNLKFKSKLQNEDNHTWAFLVNNRQYNSSYNTLLLGMFLLLYGILTFYVLNYKNINLFYHFVTMKRYL